MAVASFDESCGADRSSGSASAPGLDAAATVVLRRPVRWCPPGAGRLTSSLGTASPAASGDFDAVGHQRDGPRHFAAVSADAVHGSYRHARAARSTSDIRPAATYHATSRDGGGGNADRWSTARRRPVFDGGDLGSGAGGGRSASGWRGWLRPIGVVGPFAGGGGDPLDAAEPLSSPPGLREVTSDGAGIHAANCSGPPTALPSGDGNFDGCVGHGPHGHRGHHQCATSLWLWAQNNEPTVRPGR